MALNNWSAFFLMMTAIVYTPGPMTMFSMSSSVRNGFFIIQGSSAVAYALFGAKAFLWIRQHRLTNIQNKITAIILFFAGGILAVSKK